MSNDKLKFLVLFFISCVFVGCGNNEKDINDYEVEKAILKSAYNNNIRQRIERASSLAIPTSLYNIVPRDSSNYLTWVYIANSDGRYSEEEILSALYYQYGLEKDYFKKSDLANGERENILNSLKKFVGPNYLKIPIESLPYGEASSSAFALKPLVVESYNRDIEGFPLKGGFVHEDCWIAKFGNSYGIDVMVSGVNIPCYLHMENDNQSRLIESAIQGGDLKVEGIAYVKILPTGRRMEGEIVRVSLILTSFSTKEILGVFAL